MLVIACSCVSFLISLHPNSNSKPNPNSNPHPIPNPDPNPNPDPSPKSKSNPYRSMQLLPEGSDGRAPPPHGLARDGVPPQHGAQDSGERGR